MVEIGDFMVTDHREKSRTSAIADIMLTICLTRDYCKSERGLKWTLVVSYFRVHFEFVILNLLS